MTRYAVAVLTAGIATILITAMAIAGPSRTSIPTACRQAAATATTVITHNQTFAGLIQALEHPTSRRIVLGDNLPAYDHRTPDLGRCR